MSLRSLRAATGSAIALLVAGLVVVVLALSVILPAAVGGTAYTILTGSMRPTMPPGTLVVVRPIAPDKVRIGDVLTYQIKSGEPTVATHRVASISISMDGKYAFVMKGDSNDSADPALVRPEQIRGARWYSVPYLAYPSLKVGMNIREFVVLGAVALLFGYALLSFAGAARDWTRNRRSRQNAEPDHQIDNEGRDQALVLTGVSS